MPVSWPMWWLDAGVLAGHDSVAADELCFIPKNYFEVGCLSRPILYMYFEERFVQHNRL
jgi:hypothetical protein